MSYELVLKRVYGPPEKDDGARVLVDRLWPRGKRREDLAAEWIREVAPSPALRRAWHKGELERQEFAARYEQELQDNPESLLPLMRHARQGRLTLLTATRDPEQSHLPILREAVLAALYQEDRQAEGGESSSPTCYLPPGDLSR